MNKQGHGFCNMILIQAKIIYTQPIQWDNLIAHIGVQVLHMYHLNIKCSIKKSGHTSSKAPHTLVSSLISSRT